MTTPEPTRTELHDWKGVPFIQIEIGHTHVEVYERGVSMGGGEFYWSAEADIDDLISCLRVAQQLLADPPTHLGSPTLPRPRNENCLRPGVVPAWHQVAEEARP